eukprot:6192704-Pleurochrysis_carterae.AAC.1
MDEHSAATAPSRAIDPTPANPSSTPAPVNAPPTAPSLVNRDMLGIHEKPAVRTSFTHAELARMALSNFQMNPSTNVAHLQNVLYKTIGALKASTLRAVLLLLQEFATNICPPISTTKTCPSKDWSAGEAVAVPE